MMAEAHDGLPLARWQRISIAELAIISGLPECDLRELVDYGVLAPANPRESQWAFSVDCLTNVRKARRLRDDLELDVHAMALAMMLQDRIDELEARVRGLRARIPFGPC